MVTANGWHESLTLRKRHIIVSFARLSETHTQIQVNGNQIHTHTHTQTMALPKAIIKKSGKTERRGTFGRRVRVAPQGATENPASDTLAFVDDVPLLEPAQYSVIANMVEAAQRFGSVETTPPRVTQQNQMHTAAMSAIQDIFNLNQAAQGGDPQAIQVLMAASKTFLSKSPSVHTCVV